MTQPLDGRTAAPSPDGAPGSTEPRSTADNRLSQSQPDPNATRPPARFATSPGIDSVAELLDLLRDTGWLPRQHLDEIDRRRDEFDEPRSLARELVLRGWATPFQINELFLGRGRQLVLGPYVLAERLGEGGMGQVFKAFHPVMQRYVALKIVRPEHCGNAAARQRFLVEIRALASLAHPNIIQVHDANEAGGALYFAMEFLPGTDLGKRVKQGHPLPAARVGDWVRQAALGLQHAHERGLVHRDVKPSNLLLTGPEDGGTVKLLDLGLVRVQQPAATAAGDPLTFSGAIMGTPDYIAPEQILDAHGVDVRGDIYSLGCTLYHLLAGQPPFAAATLAEKFRNHQISEPRALEELRGDVPPSLAAVCRKMMAKDPARRYQTPREVAEALASYSAVPVAVAVELPATQTYHAATAPPPARTGRKLFWLGAAVVGVGSVILCLGVGIVGSSLLTFIGQRTGVPDNGEAGQPIGRAVETGKPLLDLPVAVAKLPEMPADGPARLIEDLKGHTGDIQCLTFSPDGKRLASGADDHQARLWNGLTGEEDRSPFRLADPVRALAFSADGKRLAGAAYGLGSEAAIKVWNLTAAGEPQTLSTKDKPGNPSDAEVHGLAFSPDGKRLAAGGGPLRVWDLGKGKKPAVFAWQKIFPSCLYAVVFAPDGKTVAAGCYEWGECVRLWEVDAPGEPVLLQGDKEALGLGHSDVRGVVAYGVGGKILVRVTSDDRHGFEGPGGTVKVWDVDAKQQRVTLRDTYKIPGGTVFALTTGADGHLRVAVASGKPRFVGINPAPPPGEIKLWDSVTGKVRTFATGHKGNITALAFSPDGARLATGSADQTVKLWDLTR